MIAELTIIKLQITASAFMGYEYFISHKIKDQIDDWANKLAQNVQRESDDKIKSQFIVLKKNIPYYLLSTAFLVIGTISFWLITVFEHDLNYFWLILLLLCAALFFIFGAVQAFVNRLVIEGLAPMFHPLLQRALTTYLLFTSKGVIAGIGMLFLLASFVARYSNAIHA